jgi:predicted AAA+ superfamily ATPase
MLVRDRHLARVRGLLDRFPVVGLLGARQVGKTTLARALAAAPGTSWFDLEHPRDAARLSDPALALEGLRGLVVIDEVQRAPGLFPLLRALADRPGAPARFLVLGSASPELLRQGSETLAGRVAFHVLDGFDLDEVGPDAAGALWVRGGFPRSFLAPDEAASREWRDAFVDTFLARDLAALGIPVPPATMRRFWTMLAHWHGQVWNGAELARAFGMSDTTVRRYLDLLAGAWMVRVLQPWHENLSKRQVRSPKVYVRDSGLLHALLGVRDHADLLGHPKVGASFEGFALAQVVRRLGARPDECFFWATHQGAELDLLVVRGERRLGFEFKHTSTPARTRSMAIARADLRLEGVDVIVPGDGTWPLGEGVRAVGVQDLDAAIAPL